MKLLPLPNRSPQGHVLAMVLVVVTICAIALTSYLQLVNSQNRAVARSQGWNATVPVMEAGVEEALAHLSANIEHGLNTEGWVRIGNYYRMERSVGDSYYVVTITIPLTNANYPIIESRGFTHMPLLVQQNSAPFFLAASGVNYNSPRPGYIGRGVRIATKHNGAYTKAILSQDKITISGDVLVDSYNSCDPAKNTGGRYDPTKAGDGGDIASNGQLINEISAGGGVKIKGHVSTGPGGTIGISGSATIGSEQWHDDGRTGIQPGWFRDDMNVNIADPPVPPSGGFPLPSGGTVNGVYYDWILTSGNYVVEGSLTMSSSQKMLIAGDVSLYVKNNIHMSGTSAIEIGEAGQLRLFGGGGTTTLSGQGLINKTGDPSRLSYYGLKNNTQVNLSGSSDFIGTIYAPQAQFSPAGGSVVHGAVVSRSTRTSGEFTLHYDQCLAKNGKPRFVVLSWDEMTPPEVAQVP